MQRPDWDHYFMAMAAVASERGTCDRKRVGAVLVKDKYVISTGYNGAIAGMPNCDEIGHDMVDGHCVRVIHAEHNALIQAAKYGHAVEGAVCYCTLSPCWLCFRLLVQAGVKRFVYAEPYRADDNAKRIGEVQRRLKIMIVTLELEQSACFDSGCELAP